MDEELFRAITAGDLARFCRLLNEREADPARNATPLGDVRHESTGQSLATAAASGGHDDMLDALWAREVPLVAQDGTGRAPIHCAAARGLVATMRFLNAVGVPLDQRCANGETAAHLAAANNRAKVLDFLRTANVDLCLPARNSLTPHHLAAAAGHREAVAALLRVRPEVPGSDQPEEAAMDEADTGSPDVDEAVRKAAEDMEALIATRDQSLPRVVLDVHSDGRLITPLRGGRADFGVPDADGNTAAHHAAARGRGGVLRQLGRAGVFLGARNRFGGTPAHDAARCGHLEALRCMEAADPSFLGVQDDAGLTPADRAYEAGATQTLRYLIDRGHLVAVAAPRADEPAPAEPPTGASPASTTPPGTTEPPGTTAPPEGASNAQGGLAGPPVVTAPPLTQWETVVSAASTASASPRPDSPAPTRRPCGGCGLM